MYFYFLFLVSYIYPSLSYFISFKNAFISSVSFINISLTCHLIRCMHRKYSNTAVNDIHAIICHDICNGSVPQDRLFPSPLSGIRLRYCLIPDALFAIYSALASLLLFFPRLPVNLLNTRPLPKYAVFFFLKCICIQWIKSLHLHQKKAYKNFSELF